MSLSGFAKTAATTGDLRWASRYATLEPKLKESVRDALSILPMQEQEKLIPGLDAANDAVRGREKQALVLLKQGWAGGLQGLLFSEQYEEIQNAHYAALGVLSEAVKNHERSLIQSTKKELVRTAVILAVALPVLCISGLLLYRLLTLLYGRIAELVVTDELTKLFNRRFLYHILSLELERGRRYSEKFSILMTDLDHFKHVNDTYGHNAGDAVLRKAAQCFASNCRPTDFACRFGGEEFVLVLPKTSGADALTFAERVRQDLEKTPIKLDDGREIRVTVSIGVTEFVRSDATETILHRADTGLYEAKDQGRNRCIFKSAI
jgi:diguanylate cyclase (GGDEF)-like protein